MADGARPPGTWIALPSVSWRERLAPNAPIVVGAPVYLGMSSTLMVRAVADDAPLWVAVLVVAAAIGVVLPGGYLVLRLLTRAPEFDASAPRARRGRRIVEAASVTGLTAARLGRDGRVLTLALRGRGVPWMALTIARDGESALEPAQRDAVTRFLAATRAELPRDRYDPHGTMSRIANPGSLTAEDAVLLVRHPEDAERVLPARHAPSVAWSVPGSRAAIGRRDLPRLPRVTASATAGATALPSPTLAQRLRPLRGALGRRLHAPALVGATILLAVVLLVRGGSARMLLPVGLVLLIMLALQVSTRIVLIRPVLGAVPRIAGDRRAFLARSRIVPLDRVTRASAYRLDTRRGLTVGMTWGGRGAPRMYALLMWASQPVLDPAQTDALASALAGCAIEPPRDPFDREGRAAPGDGGAALDASRAAALVRDPGSAPELPSWRSVVIAPSRVPRLPPLPVVGPDPEAGRPSDIPSDRWIRLPAVRRSGRSAEVDASGLWMRIGARTVHPAAITSARVLRSGRRGAADERVALRLAGRGAPRMTVLLSRAGSSVLDVAGRGPLARFVGRSRAAPPRDRFDPEGRMSAVANPGWLSADGAARLVTDPGELDRVLPPHPPILHP